MEQPMIPGETDAAIENTVKDTEPAPEAGKPEETKTDKVPEEADKPADDKPADKAPEDKEPPLTKPRSIYDDFKDEKKARKAAEARIADLEAENATLRGADKPKDDKPDEEKPAPKAEEKQLTELEAFAKEKGYDAEELARLTDIIAKNLPTSQLTDEERKDLTDLRAFKDKAEAAERRTSEDAAIQAEASAVKKQLDIHDDTELATVMAEVTRLAHTKEFADKEVDYIVYRNREALSKLVSPKKPSFEAGGQAPDAEAEAEIDLSSPKVTPEQVAKANAGGTRTQLEVRKAL